MSVTGPEGFAAAIDEILADVPAATLDEREEAARAAAERCCRDIKAKSRRDTGAYRRGWKVGVERNECAGTVEAVVYNATAPQLTHLLENGHVVANQHGTYGTVPGDHVIADAFRAAAASDGEGA